MLHASALNVSRSDGFGQFVLETARSRDGFIRMIEQNVSFYRRVHNQAEPRRRPPHKIACGKNRELLPVIGLSSSRIDRPQGSWFTSQLPTTG